MDVASKDPLTVDLQRHGVAPDRPDATAFIRHQAEVVIEQQIEIAVLVPVVAKTVEF